MTIKNTVNEEMVDAVSRCDSKKIPITYVDGAQKLKVNI